MTNRWRIRLFLCLLSVGWSSASVASVSATHLLAPPARAVRLAPSAFSPAVISTDQEESNAAADALRTTLGGGQGTYQSIRRITGWYEHGALSTAPNHTGVYYLASIFGKKRTANTAFRTIQLKNQHETLGSDWTRTTSLCASSFGTRCLIIHDVSQSGGGDEYYLFARGTCVVEAYTTADSPHWGTYKSRLLSILRNVAAAALAVTKSACTATSGPLAFSFDRLRTLNASGTPQTNFRVNQPFTLDMGWTVRNLKGPGQASREIDYQRRTGGAWTTVSTIRESFSLVNGPNSYRKTAPINATGTFRLVVTVKLQGLSRARSVQVVIGA